MDTEVVLPVTYSSALNGDRIALLVLHIPDAIYWERDATWYKEEKNLTIYQVKWSQPWAQERKSEDNHLVVYQCSLVERRSV
jgi:hypothetical protein